LLLLQFEEAWDTDSEEEAFVDSLAEKLIEDAAEAEMDLDDEDPDMEGWDDMHSDNEPNADSADEDAFMDKMDDLSDNDESDEEESQLDVGGGENFGDDAYNVDAESDNDEHTFDEPDSRVVDDEVSDDDLIIMDDSDSQDDEELVMPCKKKAKKEETEADDVFADASEYEELIKKGWEEMKQQKSANFDLDDDNTIGAADTSPKPLSGDRKKRKRHSKKKPSF